MRKRVKRVKWVGRARAMYTRLNYPFARLTKPPAVTGVSVASITPATAAVMRGGGSPSRPTTTDLGGLASERGGAGV